MCATYRSSHTYQEQTANDHNKLFVWLYKLGKHELHNFIAIRFAKLYQELAPTTTDLSRQYLLEIGLI